MDKSCVQSEHGFLTDRTCANGCAYPDREETVFGINPDLYKIPLL